VQFPITLGLHRSRILDFTSLAIAGAALAVLLASPLDSWLHFAGAVAIVAIAGLTLRALTPAIAALRIERDGSIRIHRHADASGVLSELLPGSTAHPWLTVLRLKAADGSRYNMVIAVDSLPGDDFRRLRLFLRYRNKGFSGSGDGR
jgi:toxin CptA